MKAMRLTAGLMILAFLAAPAAAQSAPDTGVEVDPQAYEGLWYEVARTPVPFQEQCAGGVTALYEIIDETSLRVVNRCDLGNGEVASIEGTAQVLNERFNALEVDFPATPSEPGVNYLIEAVGPIENGRYAWAAVRSPDDDHGWILARSSELDEDARREAEQALEAADLDITRLTPTDQPPQAYDPEQS
jgi:apolipoprotein D and lipocalin family protein